MSAFSNFAVSFSIISILAGCITSYGIALRSGGPSTLVLGWLIVGILVLAVAGAMAEVCSRYPTAGGLYFWAGRLAKRNKREWAWFTGWFNFLGEVAVTAAIDFGCATTWMAFMNLVWGVEATPGADVRPVRRDHRRARACSTPSASTWSACCPTSPPGGTSAACWSSSARCGSCPRSTSRCPGP